MTRRISKFLFAGLLFTAGCTETTKPRTSRALSLDSVPSLPSVDPKTLIISDISVSQFSNPDLEGALQPLVDFRYSGSAEYVEVMTCIEETGQCSPSKNIFQTQSTLANSPNGSEVVVKLRACVDASRSLGSSNCGQWFQSTYTQWAITDKALAALVQEAEDIESATKELKQNLEKLFKMKAERANKCQPSTPEQKALLEADRAFVESIGKLGQGAIGMIANSLTIRGGSKCLEEQRKLQEEAENKEQPAAKPKPDAPAQSAPASLNFLSSLSSGGNPILPSLNSANLKTVIDKLTEGVNKKAEAGNEEAEAAAACLEKKSADSAAGGSDGKAKTAAAGLSIKDVAEVLPDVSTAIFDIANADRAVALEGICIKNLGDKFDSALKTTESVVKSMAEQLQLRRSALKTKVKGANQ
jgi:uncharacterized protein YfcZ (UPF0381/DUF406 family)